MEYSLRDESNLIGSAKRMDSLRPEKNSYLQQEQEEQVLDPFFLVEEDRTARRNGHKKNLFGVDGRHQR